MFVIISKINTQSLSSQYEEQVLFKAFFYLIYCYSKEEVVFCVLHVKPYTEDIYDHIFCFTALRCSPVSWSSSLTSSPAENNGGTCARRQSVKKYNQRSF